MHYQVALTAKRIYSALDRSKSSFAGVGAIAILASFMFCAGYARAQAQELMLGSRLYQLEVASTAEQRRQGLMHRRHLERNQGMLLVYQQPGDHRIWMKNMLIPLRVYWIDVNYTVIGMRRVEPCKQSPCAVYSVDRDSQYILELGDYEHPLAAGDSLPGIRAD